MAAKPQQFKNGVFLGGVGGSGLGPSPEQMRRATEAKRQKAAKERFKQVQKKPSGFFESFASDIGLAFVIPSNIAVWSMPVSMFLFS